MYQTENPTQTVLGTRAEPTRRFTERVGKIELNMGSGCGAGACFLGLTSTGRSLTDSWGGVQPSIGRYQDVGHLLGELHIAQAIVKRCLTVGSPQQAEVGASPCLVPEAEVPADRSEAAVSPGVA